MSEEEEEMEPPRDLIRTRLRGRSNSDDEASPWRDAAPVAWEVREVITTTSTPSSRYLELLNILRCDILALDRLAQSIGSGETRIEDSSQYLSAIKSHAEQVLEDIETLLPDLEPEAKLENSEHVRELRLSWHRLQTVPLIADPEQPDEDVQRRLGELRSISGFCREIVFQLGYKTIPARLNDWLKQAPAGYYVPFHTVFEDEVPNEEDRTRILQLLAFQPTIVENGLVDAANGVVYRYAPEPREQVLSVVRVIGLFCLLTLLVAAWGQPGRWTEKWPFAPGSWAELLLIWFAVVAGVLVHMLVGATKRIREQSASPPVFATQEVLKRINSREGLIMVKIATALLGFFALLATDELRDIPALTAFLAGYALDSVVGLFATGLDAQAAAQTSLLKQKLKAA